MAINFQNGYELRQPKLTRIQRDAIVMSHGTLPTSQKCNPVFYNLARPDQCPYGDGTWNHNCNSTVEQGKI